MDMRPVEVLLPVSNVNSCGAKIANQLDGGIVVGKENDIRAEDGLGRIPVVDLNTIEADHLKPEAPEAEGIGVEL